MQREVIAAANSTVFVSFKELSESEPALSAKAPVNCAAWQHNAGDLAAEVTFQRRTPGHKLEAEAIIDHREPA